jgi:hypothetical protein
MKKRLRKNPTAKELAKLYPVPHDHVLYGRGHGERVDVAIDLAETVLLFENNEFEFEKYMLIADLSTGNAVIPTKIKKFFANRGNLILGDFAKGYEFTGSIEKTIDEIPSVDFFICSETLGHIAAPENLLLKLSKKTKYLLITTPIDAWDDTNIEHIWAWSKQDVEDICAAAGFIPLDFTNVDSREYGEPYNYGIWMFKKEGE